MDATQLQQLKQVLQSNQTLVLTKEDFESLGTDFTNELEDVAAVKRLATNGDVALVPVGAATPEEIPADTTELTDQEREFLRLVPEKGGRKSALELTLRHIVRPHQVSVAWREAASSVGQQVQQLLAAATIKLVFTDRYKSVRACLSKMAFSVGPTHTAGYWVDEVRLIITPTTKGVTYEKASPVDEACPMPNPTRHSVAQARTRGASLGIAAGHGVQATGGIHMESTTAYQTSFPNSDMIAVRTNLDTEELQLVWKLRCWYDKDGMPCRYLVDNPRKPPPVYPFQLGDGVHAGMELSEQSLQSVYGQWRVPDSVRFDSEYADFRCKLLVQARQWTVKGWAIPVVALSDTIMVKAKGRVGINN